MLPHQEAKWWMNQDMSYFPGPILLNKNGERRNKRNAEETSPEEDGNQLPQLWRDGSQGMETGCSLNVQAGNLY